MILPPRVTAAAHVPPPSTVPSLEHETREAQRAIGTAPTLRPPALGPLDALVYPTRDGRWRARVRSAEGQWYGPARATPERAVSDAVAEWTTAQPSALRRE